MKVFLVGGTGVIGRSAAAALVQSGHTVGSSARGIHAAAILAKIGVEAHHIDIYHSSALRYAMQGYDAVIRLATRIPHIKEFRNAKAWEETNRLRTEGARAVVDACIAAGIDHLVSESIAFLYADGGERMIDESSPVDDGGSPVLKAALESEAQANRMRSRGGRAVVLRFGALYSAEDSGTKELARMMRRWMLPRIGPAQNYISPLFLSDAGAAVAASLEVPAGIYNVVDNEPLKMIDYLHTMASALHAPPPLPLPAFMGPRMFGTAWRYASRSLKISNAAFKRESGWSPEVRNAHDGWREIAESRRSRSGPVLAARTW